MKLRINSTAAVFLAIMVHECAASRFKCKEYPFENERPGLIGAILNLIRRPAAPIAKLQLVDINSGNVVADLQNSMTVDISSLIVAVGGNNVLPSLTIRAVPGARTRSVEFRLLLTDYPYCFAVTEAPYSMCPSEEIPSWPCDELIPGKRHRLRVLAYSCRGARCGESPPFDMNLTIVANVPYVCNATTDTCGTKFDGTCNARGFTGDCRQSTDCFDCDPCRKYAMTSCETCTAQGCVWCGTEASCISSTATAVPPDSKCQVAKYVSTCPNPLSTFYTDPLFESMAWLYDMINVRDVWKSGVTGKGIGIRINDVGVDSNHVEFRSRLEVASSCPKYTPFDLSKHYNQGTAAASLAAASGNSSCSVGIAPDARLSACRVLLEVPFSVVSIDESYADRSYLHKYMATMHISSNSFSGKSCLPRTGGGRNLIGEPCPFLSNVSSSPCLAKGCSNVDWGNPTSSPNCEFDVLWYCRTNYKNDVKACSSFLDWFTECRYIGQSLAEQQAFTEGILNGRNGKGIIYVFAAGNDFGAGNDVNFEGTLNSRYVISVGAVGKDKVHASYSTPGAALFVSAPGGDSGSYSSPVNIVALSGGGCTDEGIGTQLACPVVSGVIALILQVNDNLTWRDVQGIIASTSQRVFPDDPSWTTNAAGLHHSYLYGFGIIDANAAVKASKTWVNYKPEQQFIVESGPINAAIAEFQTPNVWTLSSVTVETPSNFTVESVVVYIDLTHSSRGDLDIVLVSPQGTSSLLAPGKRPENDQITAEERWRLMTVRNWGEPANGNWTLQLVDRSPGDLATCVNLPGWSLNLTIPPSNAKFPSGFLFMDCYDLFRLHVCRNGRQASLFGYYFSGIATSINDIKFTNTKGVSLVNACCECGGGRLATTVPDVLKSWRIAVYGH